ncbi:MAG: hypothetical protein KTR32_00420 [Granulosicoccus sp.]|nr:hypothetical protein [Granulosicoccus sp.]
MSDKAKVIGIGLNKTATKSLALCFEALGYRNQSYCLDSFRLYQRQEWEKLFSMMDQFDSFEDWPWPLMYQEIDQHYSDARFVLTTRKNAELWYQSLCKMAVRMGPLRDFERHIYGHSMPQGKRHEHIHFYETHNKNVREYFKDKPGKLLEICFDDGFHMRNLSDFLGEPECQFQPPHSNKSEPVYDGDSLWQAHLHRIAFQTRWYMRKWSRGLWRRLMLVAR